METYGEMYFRMIFPSSYVLPMKGVKRARRAAGPAGAAVALHCHFMVKYYTPLKNTAQTEL